MVEHAAENRGVGGSIPPLPTVAIPRPDRLGRHGRIRRRNDMRRMGTDRHDGLALAHDCRSAPVGRRGRDRRARRLPAADAAVLASVKNGTLTVKGGNPGRRESRFGPALPGGWWWMSATTVRPTSRSAAPFTRIVVNAKGEAIVCGSTRATASSRTPRPRRSTVKRATTWCSAVRPREVLRGGTENDTIDGNPGNDDVGMGAGNDSFVWNVGDGADRSAETPTRTRSRSTGAPVPTRSPSRPPRAWSPVVSGGRRLDHGEPHRERPRWRRHDLRRSRRVSAASTDPRRRCG